MESGAVRVREALSGERVRRNSASVADVAHLHLLLATENDRALLIKHGPGRGSCTLGWDRACDQVELGQCLRSRINFCDLSPDGEHLVYCVDKHRYQVEHSVYTVLSRAPWLKALSFWSGDGTFGAHPTTGRFCRNDEGVLGLLVGRNFGQRWDEARVPLFTERPSAWRDFLQGSYWFDRLQRDGWIAETNFERVDRKTAEGIAAWHGSVHRAVFAKPLLYGWWLEQTHWCGLNDDENRGISFETFALRPPDGTRLSCDGWTSADWDARRCRVVWTADNQLHAAALSAAGLAPAVLLYDARDVGFVARKAPY